MTAQKVKVMVGVLVLALSALGLVAAIGCASTGGGSTWGIPPIPEGKGRLILETGGISEVNFYVIDQETEEEVYSETPRPEASSPIGYERDTQGRPQFVDLPPGTYTVVVNTDLPDPVELPDVEIRMGEERYLQVPIGRFQLIFSTEQGRVQIPFLVYDFNMQTLLGKGMTSTEVRYFIAPVGNYKVRIENAPAGMDEIRPVQVSFGRPQVLTIGPPPTPVQPSAGAQEEKE